MAAEPAAGTPAAATGSAEQKATADQEATADEAQPADPWFAVGPKVAAPADAAAEAGDGTAAGDRDGASRAATGAATANGVASGDSAETQAEWFLRTGRAGLLPDSMTVIWDDDGTSAPDGRHEIRVEAAGAPPWAADAADVPVSQAAPPPWETGPWPGPGGGAAEPDAARRRGAGESLESTNDAVLRRGAGSPGAATPGDDGRWSARTVLVAGLVPLVVPGLVVGILGLRQAGVPSVRKASVVAIGASIVWAVIIVLIFAGGSGGSAGPCAGYSAAVHHAYDKAMADLRDHASASAEAADLGTAATTANASAAASGQIGVRTALFTLANDMAQARTDVVAGRPVPATLRMHLAEDGATPSGTCTT